MIRRNYKDSVFRDLFGTEEHKAYALELYNALNGSHYDDPAELELTTLEDVIYIAVKNDVSFLFRDELVLWEHQSTPNPNMPLRCLLYLAELYSRLLGPDKAPLYGTRRVTMPTPRFVVFYNGERPRSDRSQERLSDCFGAGPGGLELTVDIINVNAGRNSGIMKASQTLAGYARLIALVRAFRREMPLEQAVEAAIEQCIREGVLVDYLKANREGIGYKLLTEVDLDSVLEYRRKEAFEQGIEQGIERGIEKGFEQGIEQGIGAGVAKMAAAMREMGLDERTIADALARSKESGVANGSL